MAGLINALRDAIDTVRTCSPNARQQIYARARAVVAQQEGAEGRAITFALENAIAELERQYIEQDRLEAATRAFELSLTGSSFALVA